MRVTTMWTTLDLALGAIVHHAHDKAEQTFARGRTVRPAHTTEKLTSFVVDMVATCTVGLAAPPEALAGPQGRIPGCAFLAA